MCTHPSSPPARVPPRALAALTVGLCALLGASCVNPSRMFTGRWVTAEVTEVADFSGYIELGLGQFGPELVGVMRRYDVSGSLLEVCPCGFVDSLAVRPGEGTFAAVASICGEGNWLFELRIDFTPDEPRLLGTVGAPRPGGVERYPLRLDRLDDTVAESLKVCDG